jgi:hypothetical protein
VRVIAIALDRGASAGVALLSRPALLVFAALLTDVVDAESSVVFGQALGVAVIVVVAARILRPAAAQRNYEGHEGNNCDEEQVSG